MGIITTTAYEIIKKKYPQLNLIGWSPFVGQDIIYLWGKDGKEYIGTANCSPMEMQKGLYMDWAKVLRERYDPNMTIAEITIKWDVLEDKTEEGGGMKLSPYCVEDVKVGDLVTFLEMHMCENDIEDI